MSQSVDFYFDLISPPSYLAYTQLPKIAAQTGAQINWRPVLVGAIHKATGNRAPIEVPAKGKYLLADLARYAARYQVPFRLNPHFPFSTLLHQRIATGLLLRQREAFIGYVEAMFEAIWVEGLNLTDPAVIAQVVKRAGVEPAQALALAEDAEVKDALRQTTEQAVARGVFGVPTFFVGNDMFWGQDRLEFVRAALATGA